MVLRALVCDAATGTWMLAWWVVHRAVSRPPPCRAVSLALKRIDLEPVAQSYVSRSGRARRRAARATGSQFT
jgi:hypothetical protein